MRAFAPGRVNLIGEHTDYNEGLCLPLAIERGVTVTLRPPAGTGRAPGSPFRPPAGHDVEVQALDLGEEDRFPIGAAPPTGPGQPASPGGWRAFVRGTVWELLRAGLEVPPVRVEIAGDLPRGAGLGSSAALCVALALALRTAAGEPEPDRIALARSCSRVEAEWAGARTGLLDQLALLLGKRDHALRIDMRGPALGPVPLPLDGHRLAVLGSGTERSLAASGYNRRREECERAAAALGVPSLRDAPAEDAARLPEQLARRARHVVGENERVDATVAALARRDLAEVGRLLDASHASLRDDYEVSTPEVELAVRRCREAGALGARIMGGGFGGSVLALMPPGAEPPAGALTVEPGPAARLL